MAASFSLLFALLAISASTLRAGNFNQDVDLTWGRGRGRILDSGQLLTLSLDRGSGSGFQSRNQYLLRRFEAQIKLVSGNSAGTVATFYGAMHDEIDMEFLGNLSGEPYVLHTNVFSHCKGSREQQFYLWFDPTEDFHTYSILWNPRHIVFYVDGTPIREFKNREAAGGAAYPRTQAMRMYGSLWDADDWATRGGLVKTDWFQAPFTAAFRGYAANGCVSSSSSCSSSSARWMWEELDAEGLRRMRWAQRKYMIYDYCSDRKRLPQGPPAECSARP